MEQHQRVLDKHLDLSVTLQTIFASVLRLLLHVAGRRILVPLVYVNVAVQMLVVTQAKRVARGHANVALPQHVLVRHQALSVMQQIMYVNALPLWHPALEHLTLVQAEFVSAAQQMRVAILEKHALLDHANAALHQLVSDKRRDLTVMLQTMYVKVLQV